jgi:hypothetical protein
MKTSHTLAAAGEIPRGHGRKCNDIFLCSNLRFAEWERERVRAGERECEAGAYLSIGNLWRKQRRLTDWRERERERESARASETRLEKQPAARSLVLGFISQMKLCQPHSSSTSLNGVGRVLLLRLSQYLLLLLKMQFS